MSAKCCVPDGSNTIIKALSGHISFLLLLTPNKHRRTIYFTFENMLIALNKHKDLSNHMRGISFVLPF